VGRPSTIGVIVRREPITLVIKEIALAAIDRNRCPQSIGITVRIRRNPHPRARRSRNRTAGLVAILSCGSRRNLLAGGFTPHRFDDAKHRFRTFLAQHLKTCTRAVLTTALEAGRIGASEQQSSLSVVAGQFGGTEELGASVRGSS
jgi:hypothetical protein